MFNAIHYNEFDHWNYIHISKPFPVRQWGCDRETTDNIRDIILCLMLQNPIDDMPIGNSWCTMFIEYDITKYFLQKAISE